MKRLHLLVIRSFIGPFILVFFIVLFVLLMQFLWKYIDELVGKGLEFHIIAELLMHTTASLVPLALPLAVLMSSLMTFGNMGEFNELTAMKASGISLQVVMRPMIVLIILISIGSFYFSNRVLPYTNLKMRALLFDVRKQRPDINIIPGSFYSGIDGYSLRVEDKDPSTNMLYGIRLYDHTDNKGNSNVTIAKSGRYRIIGHDRYMEFTLYDGHTYTEMPEEKKSGPRKKTYPHRYDSFDEQVINIELKGFGLKRTDEKLFRNHYALLDIAQLKHSEDSISKNVNWGKDNMMRILMGSQFFKKRTPRAKHEINDTTTQSIDSAKKTLKPSEKLAQQKLKPDLTDKKIFGSKNDPNSVNKDPEVYHNLFNKLTLKEKDEVLSGAVSYARSTQTWVSSSSNSLKAKLGTLRRFEIERHRKYTLAFACFLFLLIGAPLGAIVRKGGLGIPVVLSALLFIFYYILSLVGEKMVREGIAPALVGMWLTSFIYLVAGIFLSYKAAKDAAMLSLETYTVGIRKFLGMRRSSLMAKIDLKKSPVKPAAIKHDKIISALGAFHETISDNIQSVSTRLKPRGFLLSLVGFRESTDIILFERLYKNIITSISNSDLQSDKAIVNKLYEFPNFNHNRYLDLNWKLYARLLLLLIPPFTILIIIRHYIRLMNLKARLKFINQLTTDLIRLLQKHDIFES